VWLVPLGAVAGAAAVRRDRRWLLVVVALVAVQVVTVWPRLTDDPVAGAAVAGAFARVEGAGGTPCVVDDFTRLRLLGYTRDFAVVTARQQLGECDVVATLATAAGPGPARDADAAFRYRRDLPARTGGVLWSRAEPSCWLDPGKRCPPRAPASASG